VNSPVRLLVAVTQQQVDPLTRNGEIVLATNLLYPYLINAESLTSSPGAPLVSALTEIVDSQNAALCPNTVGSTCTQRFRVNITTNGACTITGNYGVLFNLTCQTGADCNLNPNSVATVTASIVSENFCAQVSATVAISGTLTSYSSNTYASPRTIYLVDQVSYYQAAVTSTQATLTSSTIQTVSVVNTVDNTESYLIYNNGVVNPVYTNAVHFSIDTATATTANFFFTLNSTLFNNVTGADATKNFNVQARVDVTFTGVPGTKRVILDGALSSRQVSVSSAFQVSNLQAATSSSSSSSMIVFGFVSFLVMALTWLF